MPAAWIDWLPPDVVGIALVLFLSFLIGLEREEHKEHKSGVEQYAFGGVRTFPLIGLAAYTIALLGGGQQVPQLVGFAVVGVFLLLSYWHKMTSGGLPGMTSEIAGLITYLVGVMVFQRHYWLATTISVLTMLLLQMKAALEGLTRRIAPDDVFTFTKFLLLTAVILPVVPDEPLTPFQLNPFKTWLVVVAVSAVSYASYVLQRWTRGQGGVLLSALLGGAYSSTVTTIVLAKKSSAQSGHLTAGAILMASGVMYLRLTALLAVFNRDLLRALAPALLILGATAIGAGWLWSRRDPRTTEAADSHAVSPNPLELSAAFLFALLFVAMLIFTRLVISHFGASGVYLLGALMGVSDVDPFIMSMTQAAGSSAPLPVAGAAILVAAASNNLMKGVYAAYFCAAGSSRQSFLLLAALAGLGLVPLLW